MVYSHLIARMPLPDITAAVNRFFTQKHLGEKYATVILVRINRSGELEYVNCGHVPPLLVSGGDVTRPEHGNLPVGLLADAAYEGDHVRLKPGDRFILVTDGVTEAENGQGQFFDNERLEAVAAKTPTLEEIFAAVNDFCGGTPLGDDCTVVELLYTG
jgi:serine phosphatase RsbU (regulator of sigma subunit)